MSNKMPNYNSQQKAAIRGFVDATGAKESVAVRVSEEVAISMQDPATTRWRKERRANVYFSN